MGSQSCQPIDPDSSCAHETVTTAATTATRSQRLANGPKLPRREARGQVVAPPHDENRDAGALKPQQVSGDLRRHRAQLLRQAKLAAST